MRNILSSSTGFRFCALTMLLLLARSAAADGDDWTQLGTDGSFAGWNQATGDWYSVGDAMVDPNNERRLAGKPGRGVLINGKTGRTNSLVTKQTFQDVEVHLEFMVAKGSNSGVSFHGNYEIQILDSYGVEKPTGGDCGGIYPRAEAKPTYHHIDEGSPPRVNAAKPPGQWQTLDIIFQSPRFDESGNKTAHAKFVRVVHNGLVIQENVAVPYANGTNWDRPQRPRGPVIIQGDYGPIAIRNMRVRPWNGKTDILNVPPEGFTALFNGTDLAGFRVHPKVEAMWSIEDGVLKAHGLLEQWGADLVTENEYQDYVLMIDFRMPARSDSGIHFRNLAPAMLGKIGDAEQMNIRSGGGTGDLESFHFLRDKMNVPDDKLPKVKSVDPKVGLWHTIKLTVIGKHVTIELDGKTLLDRYEYPEGILAAGPNAIRFQKHRFTEGGKPGERNPCPIEFRNMFIKEINSPGPGLVSRPEPMALATGPRERSAATKRPAASAIGSGELNVPPEGFTALFNGKDFAGWHAPPLVKEYWSIEDGVLKSPGLIENWGASLSTKKHYRDFILMLDFRMPTISDSGINFRRLIPEIPGFGDMEQFNLRSRGGMGHLESYYFLPKETAAKMGLKEEEKPHVHHIDPEVGIWHTVKLTMKGRTFSAEYDGEVIHDNFVYHDWMMNMKPAPIRLQKHIVVRGDNLGAENPCPIEYRNIFIRELGPNEHSASPMPIPHPVHHWNWSAEPDKGDGSRKAIPVRIPQGPTIHVVPFGVSEDDMPPVVLLPGSRLSVTGRLATAQPVYFGVTINHPNGDFAGRFHTVLVADKLRDGQDFDVTLDFRDFQLDSSLSGMKDKLPSEPFHFVVESIWCTTLEKQVGLEIREVELIPPSEATSSASNEGDDLGKEDPSPMAKLLARIDDGDLPEGYEPAQHQPYVDRRMEEMTQEQRARLGQLWKEKQRIDPDMPNRGHSFVRILEYVAEGGK